MNVSYQHYILQLNDELLVWIFRGVVRWSLPSLTVLSFFGIKISIGFSRKTLIFQGALTLLSATVNLSLFPFKQFLSHFHSYSQRNPQYNKFILTTWKLFHPFYILFNTSLFPIQRVNEVSSNATSDKVITSLFKLNEKKLYESTKVHLLGFFRLCHVRDPSPFSNFSFSVML